MPKFLPIVPMPRPLSHGSFFTPCLAFEIRRANSMRRRIFQFASNTDKGQTVQTWLLLSG